MRNTRFSPTKLARMDAVMMGHVDRGQIPGLVTVLARGDDVHARAMGSMTYDGNTPMRRDTLFRIASLTKPITAAAAMLLVEEGRLRLDDAVDVWLPELADRKVLSRLDGPLDDTVPAQRPISPRDLLTLRMGLGHVITPCDQWPIRQALNECQLLLGPPSPQSLPTPDEWLARVASLPLMHQPGEEWMYDLGLDVLGVLISRAAGQRFEDFLQARLFEPLGMADTGFHVPVESQHRLPGCYTFDPAKNTLEPYDDEVNSQWASPPAFASGSGGLISTVDDYLAFCRMLLNQGRHAGQQILSGASVKMMTSNQVTEDQCRRAPMFLGGTRGWGFGMAVVTHQDALGSMPGRFGWDGGLGTSAYTDPAENFIGILMSQTLMESPEPPPLFTDFWTSAYEVLRA